MLSKEQYKKLRSMVAHHGTDGRDEDKFRDMYKYFLTQDYIRRAAVRGLSGYVVTERGHAAMYAYKTENFRFWFPSVISVLALVASILSIFLK